MGGDNAEGWRKLVDEKRGRGPVDIDLKATISPAEAPPAGQDFPIEDVIELLASEGIEFRSTPDGGGSGGILLDPATVATIYVVVEVVKAVAGKFVDGFADAIGADAFEHVKAASNKLRRHKAPAVSSAKQVLSVDVMDSGVEAGRVYVHLPSETTDEALAALGKLSLPRFPEHTVLSTTLSGIRVGGGGCSCCPNAATGNSGLLFRSLTWASPL